MPWTQTPYGDWIETTGRTFDPGEFFAGQRLWTYQGREPLPPINPFAFRPTENLYYVIKGQYHPAYLSNYIGPDRRTYRVWLRPPTAVRQREEREGEREEKTPASEAELIAEGAVELGKPLDPETQAYLDRMMGDKPAGSLGVFMERVILPAVRALDVPRSLVAEMWTTAKPAEKVWMALNPGTYATYRAWVDRPEERKQILDRAWKGQSPSLTGYLLTHAAEIKNVYARLPAQVGAVLAGLVGDALYDPVTLLTLPLGLGEHATRAVAREEMARVASRVLPKEVAKPFAERIGTLIGSEGFYVDWLARREPRAVARFAREADRILLDLGMKEASQRREMIQAVVSRATDRFQSGVRYLGRRLTPIGRRPLEPEELALGRRGRGGVAPPVPEVGTERYPLLPVEKQAAPEAVQPALPLERRSAPRPEGRPLPKYERELSMAQVIWEAYGRPQELPPERIHEAISSALEATSKAEARQASLPRTEVRVGAFGREAGARAQQRISVLQQAAREHRGEGKHIWFMIQMDDHYLRQPIAELPSGFRPTWTPELRLQYALLATGEYRGPEQVASLVSPTGELLLKEVPPKTKHLLQGVETYRRLLGQYYDAGRAVVEELHALGDEAVPPTLLHLGKGYVPALGLSGGAAGPEGAAFFTRRALHARPLDEILAAAAQHEVPDVAVGIEEGARAYVNALAQLEARLHMVRKVVQASGRVGRWADRGAMARQGLYPIMLESVVGEGPEKEVRLLPFAPKDAPRRPDGVPTLVYYVDEATARDWTQKVIRPAATSWSRALMTGLIQGAQESASPYVRRAGELFERLGLEGAGEVLKRAALTGQDLAVPAALLTKTFTGAQLVDQVLSWGMIFGPRVEAASWRLPALQAGAAMLVRNVDMLAQVPHTAWTALARDRVLGGVKDFLLERAMASGATREAAEALARRQYELLIEQKIIDSGPAGALRQILESQPGWQKWFHTADGFVRRMATTALSLVQGVENVLRSAAFLKALEQGMSPARAREMVFRGFVNYTRAASPEVVNLLLDLGLWFIRYPIQRPGQVLKSLVRYPGVMPAGELGFYRALHAQQVAAAGGEAPHPDGREAQRQLVAYAVRPPTWGISWQYVPSELVPADLTVPPEARYAERGFTRFLLTYNRVRLAPLEVSEDIIRFVTDPTAQIRRFMGPLLSVPLGFARETLQALQGRPADYSSLVREIPSLGLYVQPPVQATPWQQRAAEQARREAEMREAGERPLVPRVIPPEPPASEFERTLQDDLRNVPVPSDAPWYEKMAASGWIKYRYTLATALDLPLPILRELQRMGRESGEWYIPEDEIERAIILKLQPAREAGPILAPRGLGGGRR